MRKLLCAVAASGVTALALGSPASFAQQTVPASAAENSGLWFVELAGLPTADGNTLAKVRSEKAAFRKAAKAAGIKYTERRAYDVLFNGFSVAITASARDKLGRLPGVTGLYPVINVAAPTPEQAAGSTLDLVSAISMTGARAAQDVRGLTGNGLKVGVIDTGIDIDHPAFGGGARPARRLSRRPESPTAMTSSAMPTTPAAHSDPQPHAGSESGRLRRPWHPRRRHRRRRRLQVSAASRRK